MFTHSVSVRVFSLGVAALMFATAPAFAAVENYKIDLDHSTIGFSVRHLGLSKTRGRFANTSAVIKWDEMNLKNVAIQGTVDVNSIQTDNTKRDQHLKAPDFFDAAKYPTMTFTSTQVKKSASGAYVLTGNLKIKDVTKAVSFDLAVSPQVADPFGGVRRSFEGHFKINRFDYNLNFSSKLANGSLSVGNEIDIDLEIEAVLSK